MLGLALLAAAAFGLSAWGSASIFDRLPHLEDEVAFVFEAKLIAAGQIIGDAPANPSFFSAPFVIVKDGNWFGKYPPGWPLMLAAGAFIGQMWVVNALFSALAIGLTGWIGRQRYGIATGLIAAVLLVSSPFFFIISATLMSHMSSLVWAMLALLCYLHWRKNHSWMAALGVGAAIGILFLSRPLTGVGIGIPLAIAILIDTIQLRSVRGPAVMAAAFAPFAIAFLAYNQATTGDPFTSAYVLVWEYDTIGFGSEYGRYGHDLGDALHNLRVNGDLLLEMLFGWPYRLSMVPVIIGVVVAAVRGVQSLASRGARKLSEEYRLDLLLAGMAIGLIAAHMLYWAAGAIYGPRYYFEAIGVLALLGARGIMHLVHGVRLAIGNIETEPRWIAPSLVGAVLCVMVGFSLWQAIPEQVDTYRDWYGINDDDVATVQAQHLDNALVFIHREEWQDYAPFFVENSPHLDGDVIYAIDRGDDNPKLMREYPDRDVYLFIDGALRPLSSAH